MKLLMISGVIAIVCFHNENFTRPSVWQSIWPAWYRLLYGLIVGYILVSLLFCHLNHHHVWSHLISALVPARQVACVAFNLFMSGHGAGVR